MDAFVFRFSAKQLRAIPERYLGFLVASGHCCNELAILLPYIIFEYELKEANEVESAFIVMRKFTLDRILISKIVEYDELCGKFFKEAKQADGVLLGLTNKYKPIAEKIRSAKWARIMRNKIAFHYDPKHALDALNDLDDAHPLRLIAGRIKGLTLFEFSEEIVGRPIFAGAGGGDIGKGMEVSKTFIVELVEAITKFHANATTSLFRAYGMISERQKFELREKYCSKPGDQRIPISVLT